MTTIFLFYGPDFGDVAPWLGLGLFWVLIMLVIYVGVFALMIWIFYLIIRTAVKNGILRADEARASRARAHATQQAYAPPPASYPNSDGQPTERL